MKYLFHILFNNMDYTFRVIYTGDSADSTSEYDMYKNRGMKILNTIETPYPYDFNDRYQLNIYDDDDYSYICDMHNVFLGDFKSYDEAYSHCVQYKGGKFLKDKTLMI